jgi:hypothetical protein
LPQAAINISRMEPPVALHAVVHADLIAYCARIGITPKTFGQVVLKSTAFADRLRFGKALVGSVSLAQRFMAEHPEVPRREFGAVAKAWRERIASEAADGDVGAAHADPAASVGECTDATLDQVRTLHNQESQAGEVA